MLFPHSAFYSPSEGVIPHPDLVENLVGQLQAECSNAPDRFQEIQQRVVQLAKTEREVECKHGDAPEKSQTIVSSIAQQKQVSDKILEVQTRLLALNQAHDLEGQECVAVSSAVQVREIAFDVAAHKLESLATAEAVKAIQECPDVCAAIEARNAVKRSLQGFDLGLGSWVRSIREPPLGVGEVFSACALLLDEGPVDWSGAQTMISVPESFRDRLLAVDPDEISPDALMICTVLTEQEGFNVQTIKRRSEAAAALAAWVLNIVTYHRDHKDIYDSMARSAVMAQQDAERALAKLCRTESMAPEEALSVVLSAMPREPQTGNFDAVREGFVEECKNKVKEQIVAALRALSAALSIPHSLTALSDRERQAGLALLPATIHVNVLRATGESTDMVVNPQCNVSDLREMISKLMHVPAIVQRLIMGTLVVPSSCSKMLADYAMSCGDVQLPLAQDSVLTLMLVVSFEDLWKILSSARLDDSGAWITAADALDQMARNDFERALAAFCKLLDWPEPQAMPAQVLGRRMTWQMAAGTLGKIGQEEGEVTRECERTFKHVLDASTWRPEYEPHCVALIAVLEQLALREDRRAITLIENCVSHPSQVVRMRAMESLSRIGDGQVVDTVLRILIAEMRRAHTRKRLAVLDALARLVSLRDGSHGSMASTRPQLAVVQNVDGNVVAVLKQLIANEQKHEAWSKAVSILAQLEAKDAELIGTVLMRVKSGFPPAVRAVPILAPELDAEWIDALAECAGRPEEVAATVIEVVCSVSSQCHEDLINVLMPCLTHNDCDIRLKALDAMVQMPGACFAQGTKDLAGARSAVRACSRSDWPRVRRVASKALARFGSA